MDQVLALQVALVDKILDLQELSALDLEAVLALIARQEALADQALAEQVALDSAQVALVASEVLDPSLVRVVVSAMAVLVVLDPADLVALKLVALEAPVALEALLALVALAPVALALVALALVAVVALVVALALVLVALVALASALAPLVTWIPNRHHDCAKCWPSKKPMRRSKLMRR